MHNNNPDNYWKYLDQDYIYYIILNKQDNRDIHNLFYTITKHYIYYMESSHDKTYFFLNNYKLYIMILFYYNKLHISG